MSISPTLESTKFSTQTNPQFLNNLKNIIKCKWLSVLMNLPSVKTGNLIIKKESINLYEKSDDPAESALQFMISRAISYKELMESFEALNLEEGLIFLGKQPTPIKILKHPDEVIHLKTNQMIEVNCEAECFPTPSYEFFKNEIKVCDKPVFYIKMASLEDSGNYTCVISQNRMGEVLKKKVHFKIIVEKNEKLVDTLSINLPISQTVNVGDPVTISVFLNNTNDLNNLKFEWYKFNEKNLQEEALVDNPTYTSSTLTIENFKLKDRGSYRCQVIRESTNEKIFSKQSNLEPAKLSEFDLKIALIIGNSNYETDDEEIRFCKQCSKVTPSYNLTNLNLCSAFEMLKKRLELLGFLVMSFIDLDSDSYLRALKMAREICDSVNSVSVLIYVAGHGHNYVKEDFLIPIDTKKMLHNNDHQYRKIHSSLNLCSLSNLLESFKPRHLEQNISVVCFWDLCRRTWVECPSDIDPSFKENLNYSIMFCCNIGKNGYEISEEDKELGLRKGPIFLNVLLNNLQPNLTLYDIGIKMKQDIQRMKHMRANFDKLSNLIFFSTLENNELSMPANKNSEFEYTFQDLYISEKSQKVFDYYKDDEKVLSYRFLPDIFINSMLLEIQTLNGRAYALKYQPLIFMDQIGSGKPDAVLFRIRNFLTIKRFNMNSLNNNSITLCVTYEEKTIKYDIKLPEIDIQRLYDRMNTPEIDKFIEEKKKLDLSDEMSVSSVDDESVSFDTTSNDERDS